MANTPSISFSINGQNVDLTTSKAVIQSAINPLVSFDSKTGLTSNGLTQPGNWQYFYIPNSGNPDGDDINITVTAASGFPPPPLNFLLSGAGGLGGAYGTGGAGGCDGFEESDGNSGAGTVGGNGGGGGSGVVLLANNYYSGVSSTVHNVKTYPLGSGESKISSVMYLDNSATYFYAGSGLNGISGTQIGYNLEPEATKGSFYNGTSGSGGDGGGYRGDFVTPQVNGFPSYCSLIRGGAGGNKGFPTNTEIIFPGKSYNIYTIPPGSDQIGDALPAYVPVTFADGLSANINYAGIGGNAAENGIYNGNGVAGTSGSNAFFVLSFHV
jgi:hypothetical protein